TPAACVTDSDSGAIDILAEPIDGRVFFAGDTFGGENTVHGAMESAYGEVERVLRDNG
ncbi:MAG: FAD-dependent oxidoreductase, partial [Myxococcota bacterium]